jgi:WD40 repeat protein
MAGQRGWLLLGTWLVFLFWPFCCEKAPPAAEQRPPEENALGRSDLDAKDLPKAAVARLGTRRFRRSDLFYSAAFFPDGKRLATVNRQNEVAVWDVAAGQPVAQLSGRQGRVCAVAFSPDGGTLASSGDDTTILLWDVKRLPKRR